ncbi:MAG: hypothetical protein VX670_11945, partial [Candidatus Latescibacterota bacterium]|nr:hypothetical protein [Candidatus Latescibacterota bacterium]
MKYRLLYEKLRFFQVSKREKEISINLISVDLTESMLRIGRNNSLDKGFVSDISWINADGAHLPVCT